MKTSLGGQRWKSCSAAELKGSKVILHGWRGGSPASFWLAAGFGGPWARQASSIQSREWGPRSHSPRLSFREAQDRGAAGEPLPGGVGDQRSPCSPEWSGRSKVTRFSARRVVGRFWRGAAPSSGRVRGSRAPSTAVTPHERLSRERGGSKVTLLPAGQFLGGFSGV